MDYGLNERERAAMLTLPLPCAAEPHRMIAERSFADLWRKSSKHWDAMLYLERMGLVERKVSRGETLWRPTKPKGLNLRRQLSEAA